MEKFAAHMSKFGIIYAIGAFALGLFIGYKWFGSATPKAGDSCRDLDGKEGILDASLKCIPNSGQRVNKNLSRAKWCKTPLGAWVTCFE